MKFGFGTGPRPWSARGLRVERGGFVGSLVGGNEARKKGDQVRELNASLRR